MVQTKSHNKSARDLMVKTLAVVVVASLAACGGGGVTPSSTGGGGAGVSATPYTLFASTYIAYAAQTNGAWLHSIQGGDVYTGFGNPGSYIYGYYSSSQADMNRTGLYTLQMTDNGTVPNTSADYTYIAFLAPTNATFDISASNNLVIQMGNIVTGSHANVFTVDLNNASGTTAATNDCAYDQTLSVVGNNVTLSALGVRTYVIPLSSFTCSVGNLTNLKAGGITTVAVKVVGDKNPSVVVGEFNTITVGTIGFTGTVTANDQTQLAL